MSKDQAQPAAAEADSAKMFAELAQRSSRIMSFRAGIAEAARVFARSTVHQ